MGPEKRGRRRWLRWALFAAVVLVSALLALALERSPLGRWIELRAYDLQFGGRGPLPPSPAVPITILTVDDESFDEIPDPLLLWQAHFARVIDHMIEAGVAAVGLDFLLGDVGAIDPQGAREMARVLLRAQSEDVPLVLVYRVRGDRVEQPPPLLAMAAGEESFAFANLTTDDDDFVRRQELFSRDDDGRILPGFAWAIASGFARRQGQGAPETPPEQTILINYRGLNHFPRVSFVRALSAAEAEDLEFFREHFQGRMVLIGVVADDDLHSTPLYYWVDRAERGSSRRNSGVEIHAHTITTLLEEAYILPLRRPLQNAVTWGLVGLTAFLCFALAPLPGVLLSLGTLGLYLGLSVHLFGNGWWLSLVAPLGGGLLAVGSAQAVNYALEGREKRRLRSLFRRYVNDEVIERILHAPDALALQGKRRHVAILFSDVRNFTNRSEGMDAAELVLLLNEYLTRMVDIIQARQGMVDKFLGDGIMAIFGAPLPDSQSRLHAVQAGREMQKALELLNAHLVGRGLAPLQIGIGVHFGEVVVGNVGSPRRMEYTAIGDVVNAASRIEGLSKKYPGGVLISAQVREGLPEDTPAEYVGQEQVKGKRQPLTLYRVMG